MQFPSVHWHEGLFLQPHHFQAWDRHWTERVCTGEQWQAPYSYGILEIAINHDALAAGFLQVDLLRCKTPGGVLIEWLNGSLSDRRDLRPALNAVSELHSIDSMPHAPSSSGARRNAELERVSEQSSRHVDVFVAVPKLKLGNQNVDSAEHRNGSRFRAQWLDLPDESDAASIQPVELRELNARILLSTDDLAGYDVLRIARVRRSEQDDVQVRMDSHYIPPLIDCAASSLLRHQILSTTYDLVQQYSELFSKQLLDAGGVLHANTPIDVQRLLILQAVNPTASVLRVLASSRGIHPLTLYIEMARLAGSLDLLHPNRAALATSPYDHENLGGIFFELKRRIANAIEGLQRAPYRQCAFVGNQNGMQVSIDRATFSSIRRWFIGIHQTTRSADSLHRLMSSGNLDWKLGSVRDVERLFTMRAPGVELKRSIDVPAALPKASEWNYYEVVGTDQPAWQDVQSSGSLALRVPDSMIANRDKIIGGKEIQIRAENETLTFQFALFGVA
ncbi:MAG: type VI secretion system baseplate subunit TssK [Pirellula sp.]